MRYTVITKDGTRDIVKNVDYVFINQNRVQLVGEDGDIQEAYYKDDIVIMTKFV